MTASNPWSAVLQRRISRRRALAATGVSAAAAAFLAACGGGSSKSSGDTDTKDKSSLLAKSEDTTRQAKRGGVSKWYIPLEPASFEPFATNNPLGDTKRHVYRNLVHETPGYLGPIEYKDVSPDMMESWEFSPDGLTLTMKLRQNVYWHDKPPVNGRLLDIDDILSGWERFTRIASNRSVYANAINPEAPILSLTAPDARSIVIKLKEPTVWLLAGLAQNSPGNVVVIPKETDKGLDVRREMIGTGAYMLQSHEPSLKYTLVRHPKYFEANRPFVDRIEIPFISEYATGLGQFQAGNLYTYAVKSADILPTKRQVPQLNVYQLRLAAAISSFGLSFGWQGANKVPWRDERVRQAISMAYDRDAWLDTFGNVSDLAKDGLQVDTAWASAMGAGSGWWLDPRGKDFGPNARYYKHDLAEAKKLMAAAGYAGGFQVDPGRFASIYGEKESEVLDGMIGEIGIKTNRVFMDAGIEYPKYRDGGGKFNGWAYIGGSVVANDAVAYFRWRYWSKGGLNFAGFDANGVGDHSGDRQVDELILKASREFDVKKRLPIIHELQRNLAKSQYFINRPGLFSGFSMAWPALKNFNVYEEASRGQHYHWWIDDTLAPVGKS
jgi:ABC-type transport system substrate-binding protein